MLGDAVGGLVGKKGRMSVQLDLGLEGGMVSACLGPAWIVGRGVLDRGPRPPWAGLDGLLSETLIFFSGSDDTRLELHVSAGVV